MIRTVVLILASALLAAAAPPLSPEAKLIVERIRSLRHVPDDQRGAETRKIAKQIRTLPAGAVRVGLASSLANLSTEGDFGAKTLQDVASTLAEALAATPRPDHDGAPDSAYKTLAQLERYEGVAVQLDAPAYKAALALIDEEARHRAAADFHLKDLNGKEWTLSGLRGKVVLVNFWATWCPPCRKEMPDLETFHKKLGPKGLVVLAISDEEDAKVRHFISAQGFSFPVLLDPDKAANKSFAVEGIPKSFVFNREGKLVATAIDMRTARQFKALLAKAGLR